jgi:hypothetical protein
MQNGYLDAAGNRMWMVILRCRRFRRLISARVLVDGSRVSSQASDTQLIRCAPPYMMHLSPARCASGEVPPTAATTENASLPARMASSVGKASGEG